MAKSINQVTLMGNLTRDPELKELTSTSVAEFSLALNRVYKDKEGEMQEATDYVDVVVYGRQAETTAQYLKKGSRALVDGRIQSRTWEDAEGKKRSKIEVLANDVTFLDRGEKDG